MGKRHYYIYVPYSYVEEDEMEKLNAKLTSYKD